MTEQQICCTRDLPVLGSGDYAAKTKRQVQGTLTGSRPCKQSHQKPNGRDATASPSDTKASNHLCSRAGTGIPSASLSAPNFKDGVFLPPSGARCSAAGSTSGWLFSRCRARNRVSMKSHSFGTVKPRWASHAPRRRRSNLGSGGEGVQGGKSLGSGAERDVLGLGVWLMEHMCTVRLQLQVRVEAGNLKLQSGLHWDQGHGRNRLVRMLLFGLRACIPTNDPLSSQPPVDVNRPPAAC